jgi:phosphopantetheinyl transferase
VTAVQHTVIGFLHRQAEGRANERAMVRKLANTLLEDDDSVSLHAPAGERPSLVTAHGAECGFVSLSHTRSAAVAAVSGRPIGVDVEWLQRRVRWPDLAKAHYSPEEQAWLQCQPESGRKAAFLGLWTLKEAWLKAQGLGIWRMDNARFIPRSEGSWRIPGEGWHGECLFLKNEVVASAICRDDRPVHWLEARSDGPWASLPYCRRWLARSGS